MVVSPNLTKERIKIMTDPNSIENGYCYFCGTRGDTEFCMNCGHEIGSYPKEVEALLLKSHKAGEDAVLKVSESGCECGRDHKATPVRSVTGAITSYCQFSRVTLSALQKGEIE